VDTKALYLVIHHMHKPDEEAYLVRAEDGSDAWQQVNKLHKISRGAACIPVQVEEGEVKCLHLNSAGWCDIS
jgi:hypothetical protein